MDQPRPLFVYFRPWQSPFYRWSCRLQQHSNSDRRSRRGARWPLDHGPLSSLLSCWKSPSFFLCLHFFRTSFKRMSFKFYFAHHVIMLSFRVMHEPEFFRLIYLLSWIGHCPTPASFFICFVCARERMEAGFELTTLLYLGQWKTLQCETVS